VGELCEIKGWWRASLGFSERKKAKWGDGGWKALIEVRARIRGSELAECCLYGIQRGLFVRFFREILRCQDE